MLRARPAPLALFALAGFPALAPAQDAPDRRPEASRRVVASFDFEEFAINPEPIPLGWRVAQDAPTRPRPGFPVYNNPALDPAVAFAGQGSVRLPIRGGSTSLVIEPGLIPVFPDADYRVSAMIRTAGLTHARALIDACLVDAQGRPIEASRRRCEPMLTAGDWAEAGVTLWGNWPDAAFIRLELLVLQPEQFEPEPPGYQRVWPSDVAGAAWFDDVRVVQQPRITLTTGQPGNVVVLPGAPSIDILARDLAGETLDISARVYDIEGRLAASTSSTIPAGRWKQSWTPPLTLLGWYRAVIEVSSRGQRIGHATLDFAWIPEAAPAPESHGGLGAVLVGPTAVPSRELAEAVTAARPEHLTIPVWTGSLTDGAMDDLVADLAAMLSSLPTLRGEVGFSLPRVPSDLATTLGLREEQVLRALSADPAAWGPYLDPLLDRFGQNVTRWHVGQLGDEALAAPPRELAAFEASLSRLVPGPVVALPWRADRQAPADIHGAAAYSVLVPASIPPEGVQHLVSAWREPESITPPDSPASESALAPGPDPQTPAEPLDATFIFEPFDFHQFGARAAAIDLVKRTVFAWAGSGGHDPRLALVNPWNGGDHARSPLMPRPELAVWHTLRTHLRGRQVIGELPASRGTRCIILAPRAGDDAPGALVAWNEHATPASASLDAMLTLGPVRVIDPFGNQTLIEPRTTLRGNLPARLHHIPLSDMPVFIEGVDVALLSLQSSFRIEPGMVRAEGTPRDVELVLTNPWPTPLAGRAVIVEPGGTDEAGARDRSWRLEPRTFTFEAQPGQEARMPLSLLMREFEESGAKRWVVDLRLAGREDLGWITVTAPLEVGLEGIDLRVSARRAGPSLEVEVTIANRRDQPVDLDATVFAPGFPRERRSIGQVAPRTQVIRRFTYAGAAAALAGHRITASIREADTGARLNAGTTAP